MPPESPNVVDALVPDLFQIGNLDTGTNFGGYGVQQDLTRFSEVGLRLA
jgi:hypothetical protein